MRWVQIDRDYCFATEEIVIRLNRQVEYKNSPYDRSIKYGIVYYSLQLRKVKNSQFRDLGYYFYFDNPRSSNDKSVDGIFWDSIDKVINRCEQILYELKYINSIHVNSQNEEEPEEIPEKVPRAAAKSIIRSLREKSLFLALDLQEEMELEDSLTLALDYYQNVEIHNIVDSSGLVNMIRLKEMELNIEQLIRDPEDFDFWSHIFFINSEKHDDKWLKNVLQNELSKDNEYRNVQKEMLEATLDFEIEDWSILDSVLQDPNLSWHGKAIYSLLLCYGGFLTCVNLARLGDCTIEALHPYLDELEANDLIDFDRTHLYIDSGLPRITKSYTHWDGIEPILDDIRISWGAKGLFLYLKAFPHNRETWVKSCSKEGIRKIRSYLKELQNYNYIFHDLEKTTKTELNEEYFIQQSDREHQHLMHWYHTNLRFSILKTANEGRLESILANAEYGEDKRHALSFASEYGDYEVAKLLLDTPQIDLNHQDRFKLTALHYALYSDDINMVEMLLKKKPNINCEGLIQGHRPITIAILKDNLEMLDLLIKHNVNVNALCRNGPPLVLAVDLEKTTIVEKLLLAEANPHAINWEGKTVIEIAQEKNNQGLIHIINSFDSSG